MKTYIKIVFGITLLPFILIVLFNGINFILGLLFNTPFKEINHSQIWVGETIIIVICIIYYVYITLEKDK